MTNNCRVVCTNLLAVFHSSGFPKMGTTSIHGFFGCSGYTTTHLRCTHANYCAKCMKESVDEGLPPLFKCTKELGFMSDAFSQIDGNTNEGNFFTQIDLLEDFVRGYPNATFILTFSPPPQLSRIRSFINTIIWLRYYIGY